MLSKKFFSSRSLAIILALAFITTFGVALRAQDARNDSKGADGNYGMPEDWSHHHLVFSDPGTERDAIWNGTHDHWLKIVNSPRYHHQRQRRDRDANAWKHSSQSTLKRDWNMPLGPLGKVGAGNYPAKFSFNGPPSCSDIAVFNTSLAGSGTQATILAFNNLYTGGTSPCTSTNPSVAWAYNTTTGDTVVTSPVISGGGDQVAFISSNGGHAYLNVLRPVTGQGTSYTALGTIGTTTAAPSAYSTCKAGSGSCLLRIEFANTDNDITSSPFYDYASGTDTLWVGDANGNLHKFVGVFQGSLPGEAAGNSFVTNPLTASGTTITVSTASFTSADVGDTITDSRGGIQAATTITAVTSSTTATLSKTASSVSGNDTLTLADVWPVNLATTALSSPVYDESTYIFVGSAYNGTTGTILYAVTASSGAKHGTSNSLGHGPGIIDSPMVDGTADEVYVSVGNDGGTRCSGNGCSIVVQFPTSFTTGGGTVATVGDGAGTTANIPMYSGSFDNTYFSSSSGSSPTGNLWVCGNTGDGGNNNGDPILYRIPIAANVMGTPVSESTLTSGAATCSGITEIYTNSTDYLFLSVTANGNRTGCSATNGCVYSFTNLAGATPINSAAGFASPGGASGIIVDSSTFSGSIAGANIYYTPLASDSSCTTTTGCAIKLSQSGLL